MVIDVVLELEKVGVNVMVLYCGGDYLFLIKLWIFLNFIVLVNYEKIDMEFNVNVI